MVDLISLAIFLFACCGIIFMIGKKIPLLRSVPEQLIEESFVTRPPRVHTALGRIKTLYQEKYHHYLIFSSLERMIMATRGAVARAEQGLFVLLRHVQEKQNGNGSSLKRLRYLNRLHAWKKKNGNGVKSETGNSSSGDGLLPPQ